MDTEQIITHAQQHVAARRAEAKRRRYSKWRWITLLLAIGLSVAFVVAPYPFHRKLLLAMRGVCALRPAHSYFVGGLQLPLEARTIGIYGGFLLALALLLLLRRAPARWLGSRLTRRVLLILFATMVLDGTNSTLADLGWLHLYTPTNGLRLTTGLLAGAAIAPLLLWLLGHAIYPRDRVRDVALIRSSRDLLAILAAGATYGLLIVADVAWLYVPLALIGVGGVLVLMSGVTLLVVLRVSGLEGRVTHVSDLSIPISLSLLISYTVLAWLALVHGSRASLGI